MSENPNIGCQETLFISESVSISYVLSISNIHRFLYIFSYCKLSNPTKTIQIAMNGKCCFYNKDRCGPFTKPRIPIDGLISESDLDNNVRHHLSIIIIEQKSLPINLLNEKGLIENRIGKKFQDGDNNSDRKFDHTIINSLRCM